MGHWSLGVMLSVCLRECMTVGCMGLGAVSRDVLSLATKFGVSYYEQIYILPGTEKKKYQEWDVNLFIATFLCMVIVKCH